MRVLKTLVPALCFCVLFSMTINAQNESKKRDDLVYRIVEDMPVYPGGENQLRKDIAAEVKYPEEAKKKGTQGKVYISFVVSKEGKIKDARIARGVDPVLDKEALRVMNALDKAWKPGKQRGTAVNVEYTVPIKFALDADKSDSDNSAKVTKKGDVYYIVDEMPEFPGGDKALRQYIAETVKYPAEAVKNSVQGKVYVSFIVDVDGNVVSAKIARGVDPALDKESLRVVNSLPTWKPGKQKGKSVKVQFTVPINFALS